MSRFSLRFTVTFALCAALVASWGSGARAAGIHVRLDPGSATVNPGDTITVSVNVTPADSQFNAFDLAFTYDPARLTFIAVSPISKQVGPLVTSSCGTLFHLFSSNATAGTLTANLSLLCNNVFLTGPGVVYTVKFKAGTTQGTTVVNLGDGTQFYRAGLYVNPLDVTPMSLSIGAVAAREPQPAPKSGVALALGAPTPNPRRGDATMRVPLTLARPARVQLALFDAAGRQAAVRAAESLEAGPHVVRWRPAGVPPGHYILRAASAAGDTADIPCTILP